VSTARLVSFDQERGAQQLQRLNDYVWKLRIWKDNHGQDLVEYSLMAGFVAVTAGAIMPGVASMISQIFSKVNVTTSKASTQGS
jgi:pilus assembly protein Flp/PilA